MPELSRGMFLLLLNYKGFSLAHYCKESNGLKSNIVENPCV